MLQRGKKILERLARGGTLLLLFVPSPAWSDAQRQCTAPDEQVLEWFEQLRTETWKEHYSEAGDDIPYLWGRAISSQIVHDKEDAEWKQGKLAIVTALEEVEDKAERRDLWHEFENYPAPPVDAERTLSNLRERVIQARCKRYGPYNHDGCLSHVEAERKKLGTYNGWTKTCVAFREKVMYKAIIAALEQKIIDNKGAELAAAMEAADARINRANVRLEAFAGPNNDVSSLIIWGREDGDHNRVRYPVAKAEAFSLIRDKVEETLIAYLDAGGKLQERAEFEKWDDFVRRVARHRKQAQERQTNMPVKRREFLEREINEVLGLPMVESIRYNAIREHFEISIAAAAARFEIKGWNEIPIEQAKEMKTTLLSMIPWVAFTFESGQLKVAGILFQSPLDGTIRKLVPQKMNVADMTFSE